MPDFTYTGDAGREYPFLPESAKQPTPGSTYTLDADPDDGRWAAAATKPVIKE